ncbi:hypothetical protein E3T51_15025 [Cryobacterium serini]|uniref:Uncharacterized protein n=1 Tax=Cryobacterium serini TaxID=1259201 RepID=A0A4R9BID2_9MICO|nr:hypothetical protein E3T51_15025 [Cryobacterium serini]
MRANVISVPSTENKRLIREFIFVQYSYPEPSPASYYGGDHNATTEATPGALREDAATTANIRILDPALVSDSFAQLEQFRQYYQFPANLSVDRYEIDGISQDTYEHRQRGDWRRTGSALRGRQRGAHREAGSSGRGRLCRLRCRRRQARGDHREHAGAARRVVRAHDSSLKLNLSNPGLRRGSAPPVAAADSQRSPSRRTAPTSQ